MFIKHGVSVSLIGALGMALETALSFGEEFGPNLAAATMRRLVWCYALRYKYGVVIFAHS
jgi:hypothetical protein